MRHLIRHVTARAAAAALVLWAAFTLAFVLLRLLPGDAIGARLGPDDLGTATPEQLAALRDQYGLDDPLIVQYGHSIADALRGDLGTSLATGAPVSEAIAEALPHTVALTGAALLIALAIGAAVALGAVYTTRPWLRQFLLGLPPAGVSVPTFWIGLLLIQTVSFRWGLLPAMGNQGIESLVLPALTLALPTAAVIAQVLAKSLATAWDSAYVDTARAKGASRGRILLSHALRNAALPALALAGVTVGNLLAGSVVVETVFSRSGIGRLTQLAVASRDLPVLQGLVLLAALVFVLVSLAVDLTHPLIDPRAARTAPAGDRAAKGALA